MRMSEAFYGGAEYMSEHGMHKGDYFSSRSGPQGMNEAARRGESACMLGSVLAYIELKGETVAFARVAGIGGRVLGTAVPTFNDNPSTAQEDAILKLKEIGKWCEEQGI